MVSPLEAFIFPQYLSVCRKTAIYSVPDTELAQSKSDHSVPLDHVSILSPLILAIRNLRTLRILFFFVCFEYCSEMTQFANSNVKKHCISITLLWNLRKSFEGIIWSNGRNAGKIMTYAPITA